MMANGTLIFSMVMPLAAMVFRGRPQSSPVLISHHNPKRRLAKPNLHPRLSSSAWPAPAVIISSRSGNTAKMHNHRPRRRRLEVTDWVRDVAWAPNVGLPRSYIATSSQDKPALIWTKDTPTAPWVKTALDPSTSLAPTSGAPPLPSKFPDVAWRVSCNLAGNLLAVSCCGRRI